MWWIKNGLKSVREQEDPYHGQQESLLWCLEHFPPSFLVCRAVPLTLLLATLLQVFFSTFKICYPRGVSIIPDGLSFGQLQIHPGANSHCPCWTLGKLLAAPHINHPWSHSLPKICHASPISLVSQKVSATRTPWATLCTNQNVSKASGGFFFFFNYCLLSFNFFSPTFFLYIQLIAWKRSLLLSRPMAGGW